MIGIAILSRSGAAQSAAALTISVLCLGIFLKHDDLGRPRSDTKPFRLESHHLCGRFLTQLALGCGSAIRPIFMEAENVNRTAERF
jgi:hypothetical protein